jgi:excinuclease ABC subunit B
MRHSATRALLERDDVIIVASVSCLYGIGSVETYSAMIFDLKVGEAQDQREIIRKLVASSTSATRCLPAAPSRARRQSGNLPQPLRGHRLAHQLLWRRDRGHRRIRPADRQGGRQLDKIRVYANSHYVTPAPP